MPTLTQQDSATAVPSAFGAKETVDRLEAAARARGMTVFARIDHAAGASAVGLALRPTELLIFGNAKGGTPLMQAEQTIGLELPLRALVYEDAAGSVWLAAIDPHRLAERYGLPAALTPAVDAIAAALAAVVEAATAG